ncbi:MAG: phosphonate ABC transporter substrate-binding protein [Cyanobacteria bacterium P01_F01_bin.86]
MVTRSFKKSTALFAASMLSATVLASCTTGTNTTPAPELDAEAGTEVASEAGEACAPEVTELTFGIISTESQANQAPIWEPFIDAMSEGLGRKVDPQYSTEYAAIIEAMGADKVQIAWYGGKSYIEAAKRSQAEAFARTIATDGSTGYFSHLITNKENAIVEAIDLEAGNGDEYVVENAADLRFAFNEENSTSGFLVPTYYVFAQKGVNAADIFNELQYAGSHEATALAVANDQVDVATNNNESLDRLAETAPEEREKIQIIWTSPEIPSDPLAMRNDLPDCLKEQIKEFFYSYTDGAILEPLGWSGFEPAGDVDWNTIRELEIAKNKLQVEADDTLSDEEKQAELDELEKQLEALQ